MNILIGYVMEINPYTGEVERISYDLAKELISRGHRVYLLSCIKSPTNKTYAPVCEQLILDSSDYTEGKYVMQSIEYAKKHNIDLILNQYSQNLKFLDLCYKVGNSIDAPVITAIHINPDQIIGMLGSCDNKFLRNSSIMLWLKQEIKRVLKPILKLMRKRVLRIEYSEVYRKSDKVIVLSKSYVSEFSKYISNVNLDKVDFIGNYTNMSCEIGEINKKNNIVFVGRFDFDIKRPDRIVQIWEKIYKKYSNWNLIMVGDGPCKSLIEKYVKDKGIERVQFKGFMDPTQIYAKSKIICMTSITEGLPIVLIEAASFGCVPIAFNSFSSLEDIITNQEDGIVIPAFDMKLYKDSLTNLMDDDLYYKKLSMGAKNIPLKFSKNAIVDKWEALFEAMVAGE